KYRAGVIVLRSQLTVDSLVHSFRVHSSVRGSQFGSGFTIRFGVHNSVRGSQFGSGFTVRFGVHSSVRGSQFGSGFTVRFGVHSSVDWANAKDLALRGVRDGGSGDGLRGARRSSADSPAAGR